MATTQVANLHSAFNPVLAVIMSYFNNADYLRSVVRFLDARPDFMNDGKSIDTLVNEYATLFDAYPIQAEPIPYRRVKVVKEIIERGEGVPVGDGYYYGSDSLECRWVTESHFQVFLGGKWMSAERIDWEEQAEHLSPSESIRLIH